MLGCIMQQQKQFRPMIGARKGAPDAAKLLLRRADSTSGWRSLVSRHAHNVEFAGSNPAPGTMRVRTGRWYRQPGLRCETEPARSNFPFQSSARHASAGEPAASWCCCPLNNRSGSAPNKSQPHIESARPGTLLESTKPPTRRRRTSTLSVTTR